MHPEVVANTYSYIKRMMQMLGNIKNVFSLLLRDKNILLNKRNNLPQITFNIRSKQSTSSKDEFRLSGTDNYNVTDQPIKYSSTKAATMRVNEYRDPYGDSMPWYQPFSVAASLAVFLVYFCILREENDIDLMLDNDLADTLSRIDNSLAENRKKLK
ncbi:uncharacterized protein [Anoplolepis gracilipes]|uniref:uncharacterized protein n=1 Tax=Anoplolepis gracilipes TaxID=354296 RepID=UPI003B9E20F7